MFRNAYRKLSKKKAILEADPIPDYLQKLINTMAANADENGEFRTALATMQAHAIMATVKATNGLKKATLALVWVTFGLLVATLLLAYITAFVK